MRRGARSAGARAFPGAVRVRSLALSVAFAAVAPGVVAQVQAPPLQPSRDLAQGGAAAASRADPATPLAQLLTQARLMIANGRTDDAFRALEARVGDYAGDPDFDYQLGLAALDSGRPGQAVMALERVLIVRPGFLQARAEIGRAYLALRERDNARREFEAVAAQQIPDEARRVIGQYLDAIHRSEDAKRSRLAGLLEIETGYDSNVNFGSSSGQWVLADGTAVIPLGVSLPRNSAVFAVALGLNWTVPMSGGWQWTTGGRASLRHHPGAHTLDQDQFDLSSGFAFRTGCHQLNMLGQFQHLQLGGAAFRNALGALGQWQCDLDARTQLGAYVQGFTLDFPDEPVRDARRAALGLTFARVLDGARRPILVTGLQAGSETSSRDLDNLSYDFVAARAALSIGLGGNWRGFASLSWEARDFDAVEPFFGVARSDRQTELRFGAERPLSTDWSIAPAVTFTRNRSTIDPNDFRRTQAGVTLRYRFQ